MAGAGPKRDTLAWRHEPIVELDHGLRITAKASFGRMKGRKTAALFVLRRGSGLHKTCCALPNERFSLFFLFEWGKWTEHRTRRDWLGQVGLGRRQPTRLGRRSRRLGPLNPPILG